MKTIFLISLSILLFLSKAFTQGACSNIKIESPAVSKPAQGTTKSATCSAMVVTWQGGADQTFVISANYKKKDAVALQEIPTSTIVVGCQDDGFCRATIPVTAGMTVNWSVQAISEIDGRTFYSYPFLGEQDYLIHACSESEPGKAITQTEILPQQLDKDKLIVEVYPNPVHSILNINLAKIVDRTIKKPVIRISDLNGRVVMVKQAAFSNVPINVTTLSNGSYFITVYDDNGKVRHQGKFIKN